MTGRPAVTAGGGSGIAGLAVHAAARTEPAQHQHHRPARAPRSLRVRDRVAGGA